MGPGRVDLFAHHAGMLAIGLLCSGHKGAAVAKDSGRIHEGREA
jgi:hypothetical protein